MIRTLAFLVCSVATISACTFDVTGSSSPTISANGGTGFVSFSIATGTCPWNASSDASWLVIQAPFTGSSATGTVNFTVAANPSGNERIANLTITNVGVFVITQPSSLFSATPSILQFGTYATGSHGLGAARVTVSGNLGNTGTPVPLSYTTSLGSDCAWVALTPSSGTTPGSVLVSPNLAAATLGNHSCKIVFSAAIPNNAPVTSTVVATITFVATTLSVDKPTLAFGNFVTGTTGVQVFSVTSTNPASGHSFDIALGSDCAWMSLSAPSGITPTSISASVKVGATPGSHSCTMTLNASGVSPSPTVIATVNIITTTLSATPASLPFGNFVSGVTGTQTFTVVSTSPAGSLNFVISLGSDCAWLNLSPASGTTPAAITANVKPDAAPGSHSCTITLSSNGVQQTTVIATVNVAAATLSLNPPSLLFGTYVAGTTLTQTFSVSSTNPASGLSFTTTLGSDCAWLNLTPLSGSTPATLTASTRSASPSAGSHFCVITFNAAGVSPSPTLTATVNVPSGVTITTTSLPPASAGAAYSATLVASGGTPPYSGWTVTSGTLPPGLLLDPATGILNGTPKNATGGPFSFTVTVKDSNNTLSTAQSLSIVIALFTTTDETLVTPHRATFSYSRTQPTPPPTQTFSITSKTGAQTGFTISTKVVTPPGGNWLSATSSGLSTPANVTVSVNPAGLGRGSFVGVVTVTPLTSTGLAKPLLQSSSGAADSTAPPAQNIIVTVGDIAPGPYTVTPEAVTFTAASLSQTINVDNPAQRTNTTATPVFDSPQAWLTVDKPSFVTFSSLTATANGDALAPDTYTGVLAIDDQAGTNANGFYIDLSFTVRSDRGPVLSLGQDSVSTTLASNAAPGTVTIPVLSSGAAVPINASVTGSSPWLSATDNGTGAITITMDPSQRSAGSYDGSVQVSSPSAANQAYVAVHLKVMTPPAANMPQITEIVNGASFAKGQAITPGSLITLRGLNLATSTQGASAVPLPRSLGDTSVTFNGFTAPLLYVSSTQINAQLPWDVLALGSSSGTVDAMVKAGGQTSASFQVFVGTYSPGIFIDFATNRAIAQNADGSLVAPTGANSTRSRPASPGSTISILCTGVGPVDGHVNNGEGAGSTPLRRNVTPPVVLINGNPAQTTFSGLQSQFVGINQVNVVVPAGLPPGDVPLQLQIGGITTTSQVKLTVGN